MAKLKSCCIEGCQSKVKSLGMCGVHYARHYRAKSSKCSIDWCEKPSWARGMCGAHYEYWRTHHAVETKHENIPDFFCTKCETQKYEEDFWPHPSTARKHQYWCKSCTSSYRREESKKPENPFSRHKYRLRSYGLTEEEYDSLYERQKGRCAICSVKKLPWSPVKQENRNQHFVIDHNHITNKVRGLLCANCNTAIGHMQDNPELLRKAIDYLNEYEANQ